MRESIVVIGAGPVGAAIAYGLLAQGVNVVVLDGGDRDFRAATVNGGLVWQQGKGRGMPSYQRLTRQSVALWPDFASELSQATGIDLHYEKKGGLVYCATEQDYENRRAALLRLDAERGEAEPDWEMLDSCALQGLHPRVKLGPDAMWASYGRSDGHCNPLHLLAALHAGILKRGGRLVGGSPVTSIEKTSLGGFVVHSKSQRTAADGVVIAAGLGSKSLAAQVGLDVPIRPQRGQGLITERLAPFLNLPANGLRQTREGTVQIMGSADEVGFDTSTSQEVATWLSARAIRRFPELRNANVVRQWAGLRIMTPDGHPVYAESETHKGAFVAVCHSGITLAAVHATALARAVASGRLPPEFDAFHHERFNVQKAA